jgi:hypothetical protein
MSRRYTAADKLAAREQFLRRFLDEYGADVARATALNLPPDIQADVARHASLGKNRLTSIGTGHGTPEFTLKIGYAETLGFNPARTPAKRRFVIVLDGLADGVGEVEAENLSAAQEGAREAIARMWVRAGWPTNPQPYGQAGRDARWLFEYWCRGTEPRFIGTDEPRGTADDPLTDRAVKEAIERAAKALGFDLVQRPAVALSFPNIRR